MSYTILRIININYENIYTDFYTKFNNSKNQNYQSLKDNFYNQFYLYTSPFEKNLKENNVNAIEIIYNFKELQLKWYYEKFGNFNKLKNKNDEELLFEIFNCQIKYYKPNILFFQHSTPFNNQRLNNIKNENKHIKKIILHNGIPLEKKNLKNIDYIFCALPYLKKRYELEGIKSSILYHYFNENILNKIMSSNLKTDIVFMGKTGNKNDLNHINRFEALEKIILNEANFECFSLELGREKLLNFSYKKKLRDLLLKHLHNKISKKFLTNLSTIKNKRINNFVKDLNNYKNFKNIFLHRKYPDKIREPLFGLDMYNKIYNSKITINIHTNEAKNECGNIRMFEATGLKSCLLTDNKSNLLELFEKDQEVVSYNSFSELSDKLKNLKEDNNLLKKISEAGQKRTLKNHTSKIRFNEMHEQIKKII